MNRILFFIHIYKIGKGKQKFVEVFTGSVSLLKMFSVFNICRTTSKGRASCALVLAMKATAKTPTSVRSLRLFIAEIVYVSAVGS